MAVCFFLVLFGLLGARQAHALEIHKFDASFPATGVEIPTTIAVDEDTGYVYILDLLSGKVGKFTAAGVPANWLETGTNVIQAGCSNRCNQLAVDNSGGPNQGVLYVASESEENNSSRKLFVFLPTGKEAEGMSNQSQPYTGTRFCGVATDRTEHVYIGHPNGIEPSSYKPAARGSAHVHRFKPGLWLPTGVSPENQVWPITGMMFGMPQNQFSGGSNRGCRIGSSSDGDQYFSEYEGSQFGGVLEKIEVFRAPKEYFDTRPGPPLTKVDLGSTYFTVDQSSDDVYFDHENEVVRRNEAGETLETLGPFSLSLGVAVNSQTGTVYVTQAEGPVRVFKATIGPDVSYDSAKAGATTAEIAGTISTAGAGTVTNCKVEWGTTTAYTGVKQCTPDAAVTAFTDPSTPVTASLTGLTKEQTYHYRITATNANGTSQGDDRTFTTHNVSDLSADPATDITQTAATLNGSWTSAGGTVNYAFEWGDSTAYGNVINGSSTATGAVKVSAPLTGLAPDTPDLPDETFGLYHYRIVATGPEGTTASPDRIFTTDPPAAPLLAGISASEVTANGVTLSAQVNPNLGSTFYLFEYGPSAAYGTNTPTSMVGDDDTTHSVSQGIAGLAPGVTYHYRAVATNFGGTTLGPDLIFTTPAVPLGEISPIPTTQNTTPPSQQGGATGTKPKKCKKGFVKRSGKCVKKKKKKRKKNASRSHA
jgi:hypothetical protein